MKKVLIVCTGNTCRSPMAEALFNQLAREKGLCMTANSAGLCVGDGGDHAGTYAVLAANEWRTDISSHRTRQLDESILDEADLILTMTTDHKRQVAF